MHSLSPFINLKCPLESQSRSYPISRMPAGVPAKVLYESPIESQSRSYIWSCSIFISFSYSRLLTRVSIKVLRPFPNQTNALQMNEYNEYAMQWTFQSQVINREFIFNISTQHSTISSRNSQQYISQFITIAFQYQISKYPYNYINHNLIKLNNISKHTHK